MTEATKPRILVVDDEEAVLGVLVEILADMGYETVGVSDPETAFEEIGRGGFDLLVTDILMPKLSGQDLLERVRRVRPEMPVIMITGYKTEESVVNAFRKGVVSYITKPFRPDDIERAVRAALLLKREVGSMDIELDVPKRGWVELTAPSHQEFLRRFQTFCDLLYETELDASTKNDIKLAVEEIGTNAVEWGNHGDAAKRLRITFCIFEDSVSFKIEDDGEGFHPEDGAKRAPEDAFLAMLDRIGTGKRVGGLGLRFVREVMDDVLYSERGNAVLLTKRFG